MKTHYSFLRILTGADLAIRRLPVMRAESDRPGPVVWLTACMHGEEVGGMALIHDLFNRLRKNGLHKGQIYSFPLMNPWGFETMGRNVHPTQEDLNRCFPGNPHGTLAERMAQKVFDAILDTGPSLDLHHDWVRSVPYGLLDPWHDKLSRTAWEESRQWLSHCDMLQVSDHETISGSLTHNLLARGIPALTFELGESFRINEPQIRFGVEVVWKILERLGMVDPMPNPPRPPLPRPCDGRLLEYAGGPVTAEAGIIRYQVLPGEIVRKNQPIARIYNSFGKQLKTLKAPAKAVVLGYRDYAMVFPGMPVMAFGLIKD